MVLLSSLGMAVKGILPTAWDEEMGTRGVRKDSGMEQCFETLAGMDHVTGCIQIDADLPAFEEQLNSLKIVLHGLNISDTLYFKLITVPQSSRAVREHILVLAYEKMSQYQEKLKLYIKKGILQGSFLSNFMQGFESDLVVFVLYSEPAVFIL
eukprot:c16090_g1_i2 orf=109-567(-)